MRIRALLICAVMMPAGAFAATLEDAQEEAAKALLRPICADPKSREKHVAEMVANGGEYEERSAKWELDILCEQIDLPTKPVHDTADPADTATHVDWIYDADWSPDGKLIVTAGRDKSVRIWDFATGKTVRRIDMSALPSQKPATGVGMVRSARYTNGGTSIVVTADGHPVRIFDAATGEITGEIPYQHPDPKWEMPPFIAATDGGVVVLGGYGGEIVAYDLKAKKERFRLPGAKENYPHFAVSRDGRLLATALPGEGGHVRVAVADLGTGKPVWSFDAKTGREYDNNPSAIALSRDGRQLALDVTGLTLVYDLSEKKQTATIPAHPYFGGRNLTFTADGKGVISGVTHAMLMDIAGAKRVRHFGPFSDNFHAAAVSPDGKYLVTGHLGSDGRIWEIPTGTFFWRLGKDVKPPR